MLTRLLFVLVCSPLTAGTVVITSLPDETRPLDPLTTLGGVPLASGAAIQVGGFPDMAEDEILDLAATGGLGAVTAAFVPFGGAHAVGEGAEGEPGRFEIAAKQPLSDSPLVGEEVSLLVEHDGQFLVARFQGRTFEADPETGLDPLLSLHLADATVIVGNRYGTSKIAASTPPENGSFERWITTFPAITDPVLRDPDADADGDGRSNFFEYSTGGDPSSNADLAACQLVADESGDLWVRFSRSAGIGTIRYEVETSPDLAEPWQVIAGNPEVDPDPPVTGSSNWMRFRVPQSTTGRAFFRLNARKFLGLSDLDPDVAAYVVATGGLHGWNPGKLAALDECVVRLKLAGLEPRQLFVFGSDYKARSGSSIRAVIGSNGSLAGNATEGAEDVTLLGNAVIDFPNPPSLKSTALTEFSLMATAKAAANYVGVIATPPYEAKMGPELMLDGSSVQGNDIGQAFGDVSSSVGWRGTEIAVPHGIKAPLALGYKGATTYMFMRARVAASEGLACRRASTTATAISGLETTGAAISILPDPVLAFRLLRPKR